MQSIRPTINISINIFWNFSRRKKAVELDDDFESLRALYRTIELSNYRTIVLVAHHPPVVAAFLSVPGFLRKQPAFKKRFFDCRSCCFLEVPLGVLEVSHAHINRLPLQFD